jgi:hypothetical protein
MYGEGGIAAMFSIAFFLTSCTHPVANEPRNSLHLTMAMKLGGNLTYDETVTDSTVLPSNFIDSSTTFKAIFCNSQTSSYHFVVSIPDTSLPYFQTVQTLTSPSVRDTTGPGGSQLWKTVTYGGTADDYDSSGALANSYTLTLDSADLNGLPLIATDTVTANDSIRTLFEANMTSNGQTVTTGTGGEIISSASVPGVSGFSGIAYFNPNYLTMDSVVLSKSGSQYSRSHISYTTVGAWRVASFITDWNYLTLPSTEQSAITTAANGDDYSYLYSTVHVKITTISDISIP